MTDPTSRRAGLSPEKLALLRRRLGGDATAAKPRETIPRAPGPGPAYPMSFAQARMWFVAQYDPENPMYNVPSAAMIDADVDVEALERAFTLAVRRHMGLRTVFRMVEGELQQVVLDPFPARVEVRDIRDRVRGIEDVERAVSEESARPFDLAEGPLFRVTLLRVSDDKCAFVTTLHHIITDGWSSLVLGREVDGFYGDYVAGREPSPPEPELQYPDYAVWQREWLSGERLKSQVAYWRERLAGAPALELPTDRPRPPEQSFRGAFEAFRLPERLARQLRQVGKEESATLNMVILAAFAALMGKWAGQDDLVVGTILGNRNRPEVEALIGLLANTAALRLDLSGDPTFRDAVRQARRAVLDASSHQDLPFEKLVEELQLERDPSRQAVFQAMYFHHSYVAAHQTHDGGLSDLLNARPIHEDADTWMIDVGVAKFDLTFTTIEMEDGGLSGLLEYATDLFDASTMGRFARQLATVLESASAQPDLPLSRVSLLDDAERRRVLSEWSITAALSPRAPFHRHFEAWAARTPDAPALAGAGGERLTYAELNARANRLARGLAALGVGPESIVAVSLERSAEMVVALLAVLKAGGAFLPIDPEYPAQRRQWMVEDSSPRVIVTRSSLVSGLPATDAAVVEIDALAGEIEGEDDSNLPVEVDLENAAYVIFTSGSTGRPKGVVVPHRGIGNLADAQREAFAISPESRVLQLASFSFDAAVAEVAHALLNGACLVLAPSARTAGPELVSFLREERVTVATMPPSLLSALPDEALPALETVVSAGEAAHPETVRRWGEGRRFVNAYGPTETTVCATVAVDPSPEAGRIPVGRPIPNVRVYVLDPAMNPLPAGVPGELYVGAIGVARGYLGKPGMTAERFVPDPYSGEPGARLYRTGDRARWTVGGELEFFGRIDTQVKVRGFRVELEEVENALLAHPGVRAAAAAVREDVPGHPRLVGYVVSANGSGADTAAVRAFVRERLPEHMVPAAVVELAVLPLSPSGKVDRAALPAPQAPGAEGGFTAPRGAAEETLARIWAQVLRRERVGVHDNFFELGGDSILSIQVIVRAAREGVRITPRQVFQHQTIAELAAAAEGATEGARAEQGAVTGEAPLTPVQRWFFAQEIPRPHHWNMGMLLEARVPVDPALLARAGEAVLAHHDALRTRFERSGDGWRQSFAAPEGAPPVDVFDLSAVGDAAVDEEMNARASEVHASLDFTRGPTVRLALFDLGPNRPARIIAAVHHLVIDAVSWTAFAEDLDAAYRALAAGKDIDLPPKTTPFRDWARRLAEHARSPEMKAEAAYWLDAIPAIVPPVPVDDAEAPDTESGIAAAFAQLDEEETRALLEDVPAAYRTQVNDALLAALAMAYREWSGRDSVLVEVEGHGREDLFPELDVSRTVGWFTTAHPVHLRALEGGPGETLKEVKETLRGIPGRGIGFGILRWMGDEETAARLAALPAPGISFNYLGQAAGAEEDRVSALVRVGGPLGAVRAADTPRGHRIAVDGAVVEGRLRLGFFFGGASYRPGTVERLAAAYEAALRSLIEHCGGPGSGGGGGFTPSDFPLAGLDQAALDSLLEDLGGASAIDGGGAAPIRGQVEDVYPLTPLQEGMLFHALHSPGSGAYAEQVALELEGEVDPEAFAGAWRAVVEATPIFRSAFAWNGLARPLQAVMRRPELPFAQLDWSGADAEERERRWGALVDADRAAGWKLGRAPLMRFSLIRLGAERWRVLLSFHHLLMDGWSMGLVLADFSAAYAALREGRAPNLPRRAPFRDYVAWLGKRDAAAAEAYWRARLAGVDEPTPLPLDRQPALAGETADEHAQEGLLLSAAVAAGVREAARRWRVTANTVAEAAWGAVLARYTGRSEVVFGATVSGRPPELAGVERMIGLFINTIPVRGSVPRSGAVGAWLRGWQEHQAEARDHEHAPLSLIRTWAAIPGDAPLFETLFVFENYPLAEEGDTPTEGFAVTGAKSSERTNYPLSLAVAPVPDGLRLSATFDSRRLDGARVRTLLEAYGAVLGCLARGEGSCAALDPLSAAERARVVHEWNRTGAEFPRVPAHRLFEEWAARTPHATALRLDPAETVSYAELNARANRLARRLRALGIGRESRVGIALERSAELIVAILAVVKAGGAYVPLDPEYPPARLAYMLGDAGASVVIARTALSVAEWAGDARVVALEGEREALAALSPENLEVEVDPEGLAYVLYTSGSTGLPKGTGVPHRAVVRLVRGQSFCRMDADEVVLQMVPVAFDVSTFEIWGPLANGGCMAVYPPGIPEPRAVGDFVRRHGVTTAWLTAGLFHQAVDEGLPGFEGVRQLLAGGDVISPAHAARAMEILPNVRLIDGYGPTEATTFTSCHTVRPEDLLGSSIPVGAPLANARHYVLDAWMRPVPIGVAGELYIAGDGVARGYLGRPALTAEKFVPDPFSALPGGRLYRTGDRVRWTHGGIIEFLGRLDGQVKLRGFRIELGDVEAALRSHSAVRDATAIVRGDGDQRRLLAYVVLETEGGAGDSGGSDDPGFAEALKEHVAERVPSFMVPATVVVLDSIPLTPNGKVDRRALPEPDLAAADPYEAPATATETALAAIWEELLGVSRVGAGQRFFESGGHSLLAMRMVTEIATRLGVELPLRAVFDSPRLRDLAARVDEVRDQALAALLAELGIAGLGGMEGDVAQMS